MSESRTFVVGDIHGRVEALREVLSLSGYVDGSDRLILLGDVCDRGLNTRQVLDLLITLKGPVLIKGNHDIWALKWMETGVEPDKWLENGGGATIESYGCSHLFVPSSHIEFLKKGIPYYEENGCLFVHGGFDPEKSVIEQGEEIFAWDRNLPSYVQKQEIPNYRTVYIGHTPTELETGKLKPVFRKNLVMADCGAGYCGRLCMMNTEDLSYVLSLIQVSPQKLKSKRRKK
jgi:serine/threonine protein phosphatase 1